MTDTEIVDCIRLLQAADDILIANEEHLVAAHLSMVIELLRKRTDQI